MGPRKRRINRERRTNREAGLGPRGERLEVAVCARRLPSLAHSAAARGLSAKVFRALFVRCFSARV